MESNNNSESEEDELLKRILSVAYEDYYDCLVVMQPEVVKLIAINTGRTLSSIAPLRNGEEFVAMALNMRRKIFIANSLGEIGFYRLGDGGMLFKLTPFQNMEPIQFKGQHKGRSTRNLKMSTSNGDEKNMSPAYRITFIDFNTYNNVLVVIGEGDTHSIMVTYDNFSSLEPSKKKEVLFEQANLKSFCSASKFNLFYVASNDPELVSIWDYHNFNIIRTIELRESIQDISCDPYKFNLLFIVTKYEIRVMKMCHIDAKNNLRLGVNGDILTALVKSDFILKSH